ncbi:MAG: hypothetical protein MHM6MM_005118 [Cercozoa sp. M6MM]
MYSRQLLRKVVLRNARPLAAAPAAAKSILKSAGKLRKKALERKTSARKAAAAVPSEAADEKVVAGDEAKQLVRARMAYLAKQFSEATDGYTLISLMRQELESGDELDSLRRCVSLFENAELDVRNHALAQPEFVELINETIRRMTSTGRVRALPPNKLAQLMWCCARFSVRPSSVIVSLHARFTAAVAEANRTNNTEHLEALTDAFLSPSCAAEFLYACAELRVELPKNFLKRVPLVITPAVLASFSARQLADFAISLPLIDPTCDSLPHQFYKMLYRELETCLQHNIENNKLGTSAENIQKIYRLDLWRRSLPGHQVFMSKSKCSHVGLDSAPVLSVTSRLRAAWTLDKGLGEWIGPPYSSQSAEDFAQFLFAYDMHIGKIKPARLDGYNVDFFDAERELVFEVLKPHDFLRLDDARALADSHPEGSVWEQSLPGELKKSALNPGRLRGTTLLKLRFFYARLLDVALVPYWVLYPTRAVGEEVDSVSLWNTVDGCIRRATNDKKFLPRKQSLRTVVTDTIGRRRNHTAYWDRLARRRCEEFLAGTEEAKNVEWRQLSNLELDSGSLSLMPRTGKVPLGQVPSRFERRITWSVPSPSELWSSIRLRRHHHLPDEDAKRLYRTLWFPALTVFSVNNYLLSLGSIEDKEREESLQDLVHEYNGKDPWYRDPTPLARYLRRRGCLRYRKNAPRGRDFFRPEEQEAQTE